MYCIIFQHSCGQLIYIINKKSPDTTYIVVFSYEVLVAYWEIKKQWLYTSTNQKVAVAALTCINGGFGGLVEKKQMDVDGARSTRILAEDPASFTTKFYLSYLLQISQR